MWEQFTNLKTWQKAFIVSFLIFIPLSAGIGLFLLAPNFLTNPVNTTEDDTDDPTKQEDDTKNQTLLLTGELNAVDANHYGSGNVSIIDENNGSINLYFIDVDIATGPGLLVYLSNKGSFTGLYDDPGIYYDLGSMDFNVGNFTMAIPQEVNISDYHSLLIWCDPFDVVFSWASLQSP